MLIAAILLLSLLAPGPASAASAASDSEVAARAGDEKILVEDVEQALNEGLGDRELTDAVRPRLQAEALELVVDQRLILARLRRAGQAAGKLKLDRAIAGLQAAAERRGQSFDDFLRENGQTERGLRRQLEWRLSWAAWLDAQLTDEARQTYFDAHRREFDGTELHVSHILLAIEEPRTAATVQDAIERAAALRKQIVEGDLSFVAAAEEHSRGPSRRNGGALGFIPRRGRMSEEFSAAAFALEEEQISPPVVSAFGVHLILRGKERPGDKSAGDVREELDPHVIRHLFRGMADDERARTRIEFTGALPHLDPTTGEAIAAPATLEPSEPGNEDGPGSPASNAANREPRE